MPTTKHWLLRKVGPEYRARTSETSREEIGLAKDSQDTIRKEPQEPHDLNPNVDQSEHVRHMKKYGISSRN